jgi:3-deoxy-manno-octulosonate cytidylyltransferase (CMP-KDO synthetase)
MNSEPKIIGVIPARYQSKRFHGKVIAPLLDKPMICHVYEGVLQSQLLNEIIVATDSQAVAEVCHQHQIPWKMTSEDHISGTDRVQEIASMTSGDFYINIQGDEPLINGSVIDAVIRPFLDNPTTQLTTLKRRITQIEDIKNPNVVKVITNHRKHAIYFSRSPIPFNRDNEPDILFFKHLGIYGYRRDILDEICKLEPTMLERSEKLEQLRFLEYGYQITVVETDYETIGVDTEEDLYRVEHLMKSRKS